MKATEAVMIGAGQRGREAFGAFALRNPGELRFTAVVEPNEERREVFARAHGIAPERRFARLEQLLERPPLAPLAFNATQDRQHRDSAIALLERGYELLLEKPMAVTPRECVEIAAAARRLGRMLQICHPLRFTLFYLKVKELLDRGAIGRLISFSMEENVGYWHFAHSYVRGNWRRREESGPLILTKCCHDMDLAVWLAASAPRRVASFGSLSGFRADRAPEGAPARCTDGCPVEAACPFHAPAFYLGWMSGWPVSVVSLDLSPEARMRALREGPYGRCVYRCDNDVVDHQAVAVEFESGATLDFTVRAHSFDCYRVLRIMGSEGELIGHFERGEVHVARFRRGGGNPRTEEIHRPGFMEGSHGGGDTGVIRNFLRCHRESDFASLEESLRIAVEGHLLAFAAEEARVSGAILPVQAP